jgi:hypothetical protein
MTAVLKPRTAGASLRNEVLSGSIAVLTQRRHGMRPKREGLAL